LNSNSDAIYVYFESKLKIHGSVFENCNYGISSGSKSETQAFNCSFLQMREYFSCCYNSAIINLNGCEFVDQKKNSFFYSASEGFLKVIGFKMEQSNKDLLIAAIQNKGKLSILSSSIEWNGIYIILHLLVIHLSST
jgi:hypothetical protein